MLQLHHWPKECPREHSYTVYVNHEFLDLYHSQECSFGSFDCDEPVEIQITYQRKIEKLRLQPANTKIEIHEEPRSIRFTLKPGQFISLETTLSESGLTHPLYLFANPPEKEARPSKDDPHVHYYEAGKIHEVGHIELKSNEHLYIEPGAVVLGKVRSFRSENIKISGRGILDGSLYEKHQCLMIFEQCTHVDLSGIIFHATSAWNVVPAKSRDIHIHNLKIIGWVITSDGIDVVGSENVHIHDCFIRANDDCISIKSRNIDTFTREEWRGDVRNVLVENCVFYNHRCGNAMEIGYETQCDSITDITFRNIDVIRANGDGGVFTIHNGDRAHVDNILYEDIRVEHYFTLLIDFRIMKSRYSRDSKRGKITNVMFKNIYAIEDIYNTTCLIGGLDQAHHISNITFDNFCIDHQPIRSGDEINLFTRYAEDVKFNP